jgi:hypothetical protein
MIEEIPKRFLEHGIFDRTARFLVMVPATTAPAHAWQLPCDHGATGTMPTHGRPAGGAGSIALALRTETAPTHRQYAKAAPMFVPPGDVVAR